MTDNFLALDLAGENLTERHLAWFYHQLYRPFSYEQMRRPITRDEHYQAVLDLLNRRHFSDLTERNAYIREMSARCEANLLPERAFSWIDKRNNRLCYWLWLHLAIHRNLASVITPGTNEAIFNDIIRHFDLMHGSTYQKLSLLNELRAMWKQREHADVDWIKENDEPQCLWALRYLERKGMRLFLAPTSNELLTFMNTYHRVLVTLDLWQFDPADPSGFTEKMKLAWKQKKVRENAKRKAGKVKVQLSEKHLLMLDAVCEMYEHGSPKETLSVLIETEYQKLKTSWKKSLL